MTYQSCLACKAAGSDPLEGAGVTVSYDPGITMPGTPTIGGHRLAARVVAALVLKRGVQDVMDDYYALTREEVLVACWWSGLYGPPKLRKALKAWATIAGWHLWYRCIQIEDPPKE